MRIVGIYLVVLIATIGILTFSMVWQFNSFQQNLAHMDFALPASTQTPSLDINNELKKITEQAADESSPATKEFATADKALSFFYSPLWQETASGPLPAGQGTMLFTASRINIAQLSVAYLTVRELPQTNLEDVIAALKNEGSTAKLAINDIGSRDIKSGKIEVLEATYDLELSSQGTPSTLNARMAVATTGGKSYVITVYGSQNIWDSVKTESDTLFASMQIAAATKNSQTNQAPAQQ